MLNQIVESCRFLLKNFPEAQECRNYLDSRLNEESQEIFQFGYFPGMNNFQVLTSLVGENDLQQNKLLYFKNIEDSLGPRKIPKLYFENYPLILPYKNIYGEPVALVGRTLLPEKERKKLGISKYKNTPETKSFKKGYLLFGLYENKKSILEQNCVYIVEGQFDVIKAVQNGFTNIVALGSADMTPYQFSVISRYTDNICLLLDNDQAGITGRGRIVDKFGQLANIKNFYLPDEFKDIDEYFSQNTYQSLSFIVKD